MIVWDKNESDAIIASIIEDPSDLKKTSRYILPKRSWTCNFKKKC